MGRRRVRRPGRSADPIPASPQAWLRVCRAP